MIAGPPPAALAVSPARLALRADGSAAVEIRNAGNTAAIVFAAVAGYAVDAAGRPHEIAGGDRVRLLVRPRAVSLAADGTAHVVVSAKAARGARPGDHAELLVLATRPVAAGGVGIRLRIGVPVVVRVAGEVVRRVVVERVSVRASRGGDILGVVLRNRGNVVEQLTPATFALRLMRAGRAVARIRVPRRELLPGARAVLRLRCPRRLSGDIGVLVRVGTGRPRTWRIELP